MEKEILQDGINVLNIEISSLQDAVLKLDDSFVNAVKLLLNCKGRTVVVGMGKSGHIGEKIAATFASVGTPAFFVHPAEAMHGDAGMFVKGDVVIMISYSGETGEIVSILPLLKRLQLPIISITGNKRSTLAKNSDVVLDGGVISEACPLNLAPTSSTTVALAIGDALGIAAMKQKRFTRENFAFAHPAGSLGRQLAPVKEIWHSGEELPIVTLKTTLKDLLYIISSKGFGVAIVVNDGGEVIGIVTDGDLRRGMEHAENLSELTVASTMNHNPRLINGDMLAGDVMKIMQNHSITSLIGVDTDRKPVGLIHLHDLLKAGIQ